MGIRNDAKKRLHQCAKSVIQACRRVLDFYKKSFEEPPARGLHYDAAIANPGFPAIPARISLQSVEEMRRDEDMEQRFEGSASFHSLKVTKDRVMPMEGRGELA